MTDKVTFLPGAPPESPPLRVTLAGEPREAPPAAVLWFLEHHPRAEDGPPFTVQRAARLAAAEHMAYTRDNGFWWERVPAEGFAGACRLRLYELDRFRGESAIFYPDDPGLERMTLAWLALDAIDPRAALA